MQLRQRLPTPATPILAPSPLASEGPPLAVAAPTKSLIPERRRHCLLTAAVAMFRSFLG